MNPEVNVSQDDETSSVSEESSSLPGYTQTTTTTAAAGATTPNLTTTPTPSRHTSANPEMKRSAVKQLIERYFFQLQRGCGNPKCQNSNCASSGQVAAMTPNEYAARALQLFSQDAKLCEHYGQQQQNQQPPKVARTQNESPTSSRSASAASTPVSHQDTEMLSPNESSASSSSSSGNSTITSGSSNSNSSSTSSTSGSSTTTNSTNTNMSSCGIDATPQLEVPSLNLIADSENAFGLKQPSVATTSQASQQPAVLPKRVSDPPTPTRMPVPYLDEQVLDELLEECHKANSYECLLHALKVYSSVEKLGQSFRRPLSVPLPDASATNTKLQEFLGKSPGEFKKEDLRTLQGENDKDEDSSQPQEDNLSTEYPLGGAAAVLCADEDDVSMDEDELLAAVALSSVAGRRTKQRVEGESSINSHSSETTVDLESLRRVKKKLYDLNNTSVMEAISNNIISLTDSILARRMRVRERDRAIWEQILHCLVICFDRTTNTSNRFADLEFMERSLPNLCHATSILPVAVQARLARIWAAHCKDQLHTLVQCLQQMITLRVIYYEDSVLVQENTDVIAITKVLKIVFYANILAGELETPKPYLQLDSGETKAASTNTFTAAADTSNTNTNDDDDMFFYTHVPKPNYPKFAENLLEQELKVTSMDCRVPLVPYEEFYNEPLSDAIQMDRDYLCYKNLSLDPSGENSHFSFMLYSFVLTPATKVIALYYDSRIRMYSERNSAIYSLLNYTGDNLEVSARPDLKLKIRRDNIVNDALVGLELVAMSNPKDLKKQLVVEFVGEQGIDEGGVSKEFFQLIVEEIFNPDFGMFTHQEDTNTVWFNSTPFENEDQFTLVGIILGLAIYNNIILAVNFPMVVYRKLMDGQGTFYDLADWNPTLYRSLKSMLEYEEPDMEEVFMQTFKISYKNVFGEVLEHELKHGGSELTVGQHNKQEFIDLYSDFLLNKSIERQFKAFKKGFDMVTDESPLKLLFRPEEIELLVCGSRKFDFVELEESTEYEGGYTKDTQIIKDFWAIVHAMPDESKRKLLEFTTGSNRVPVGGLSRLKLLITRHGPDSDRLPTSHTCFNVLLLPEYDSKEKLEERLLKAINYSKGFGML